MKKIISILSLILVCGSALAASVTETVTGSVKKNVGFGVWFTNSVSGPVSAEFVFHPNTNASYYIFLYYLDPSTGYLLKQEVMLMTSTFVYSQSPPGPIIYINGTDWDLTLNDINGGLPGAYFALIQIDRGTSSGINITVTSND